MIKNDTEAQRTLTSPRGGAFAPVAPPLATGLHGESRIFWKGIQILQGVQETQILKRGQWQSPYSGVLEASP
jgi:hypothetical protein